MRPKFFSSRIVTALGWAAALAAPLPAAEPVAIFTDAAAETGLDFVHWNGMSGELYFPEMTGQGGALLDYDGDGDLDVYLVQGALLGAGKKLGDATVPLTGTPPARDRLLRNDLGKDGRPRFVDVTDKAGLRATGYGMGVATGDIDNDGDVDLYLTNYGSNQLWRNDGDGTWTDVTAAAGVDDPRWSTSASFVDIDRDGWLDLFVLGYVEFDVARNPVCYATSSRRDYCGPSSFPGLSDRLFRNRGDGTFEDVSPRARVAAAPAAGLGVVTGDFDDDGWSDLYIANDGVANHLWLNQRDGTLRDEALLAGVAVNRQGKPEASMGVTAGDFDNDGDEDLFMAHLAGETNTLYVNEGGGLFEERTIETGLGAASVAFTSFGTAWIDYDNDGWLDLLVVSGAVRIIETRAAAGDPYPLAQTNQLFRNLGGGKLEDVTGRAGAVFSLAEVSRGAAFGDIDNDGDIDALIHNNSGPVRLLRNEVGQDRPWIGLRLLDRSGRDALGAKVEVVRRGAGSLWRWVRTDGSYCSANDPRLLVGLGDAGSVEAVRVHWPGAAVETWKKPATGRFHTLRQGGGETAKDDETAKGDG